uniref:Uncharacterized protein n=1 Tax=Ciona savignyi TaxID=51511 RepID=H2ZPA8_CIOSA
MVEIGDIIPTQRLESTLWSIVVFSYLPLGVLLMLIRIFLTLNYVCMQVVFNCVCSHRNAVRRIFEKIFLFVMGVTLHERNQKSRDLSSLWIANHLSNVDLYFLAALCNLKAAADLRGTNTLRSVLRCIHTNTPPSDADVQVMAELTHNGIPVLVLPQPHPTNGNGLLKF